MENNQVQEAPVQTFSQSLTIKGPLPSATEFSGYEKVLPGAAERILGMAEKEAANRQEMEKEIVGKTFRLNCRGQIFGFILGLLSLGAVYLSIILKQPAGAIVPAIISVTSLAAVFISRNRIR